MPAYMMRCHHPQHVASRAAAALLLRTTTPPALLLLLLLLAHTSGPAAGYPNLWRQCGGQHPDGGAGRHGAAKPDPSMTFVLQGLGAPQAGYCPGGKYTVRVTFDSARKALLTSNMGSFSNSIGCEGSRQFFLVTLPVQQADITLPCDAAGDLRLKVTSATSALANYLQGTATFPRASDAVCNAANLCTTTTATTATTTTTTTTTAPAAAPSTAGTSASPQQEGGASGATAVPAAAGGASRAPAVQGAQGPAQAPVEGGAVQAPVVAPVMQQAPAVPASVPAPVPAPQVQVPVQAPVQVPAAAGEYYDVEYLDEPGAAVAGGAGGQQAAAGAADGSAAVEAVGATGVAAAPSTAAAGTTPVVTATNGSSSAAGLGPINVTILPPVGVAGQEEIAGGVGGAGGAGAGGAGAGGASTTESPGSGRNSGSGVGPCAVTPVMGLLAAAVLVAMLQ